MIISKNNRKHYVSIKSLNRLLSSENTNHKGKEYFCMNCLQGFKEESSRDEHTGYCVDNESLKVESHIRIREYNIQMINSNLRFYL